MTDSKLGMASLLQKKNHPTFDIYLVPNCNDHFLYPVSDEMGCSLWQFVPNKLLFIMVWIFNLLGKLISKFPGSKF